MGLLLCFLGVCGHTRSYEGRFHDVGRGVWWVSSLSWMDIYVEGLVEQLGKSTMLSRIEFLKHRTLRI